MGNKRKPHAKDGLTPKKVLKKKKLANVHSCQNMSKIWQNDASILLSMQ